jgi:hypothetical protein
MRMNVRIRLLATLLISIFLERTAQSAIYQLIDYPSLQNGLSISGTIDAIDINADLVLDAAEVSTWTLQIDGNSVSSSHPNAGELFSNVSISSGMIFLEDPRISGQNSQLILAKTLSTFVSYFNGTHSSEFNEQVYNGRSSTVPSPGWAVGTLSTNGPNLPMPVSNGRVVIARLIPEPPSFALLAVGLAFVRVRYRI